MAFYLKLDAYAEVEDCLKTLKSRGKRIAILSNGSPSMLDSTVRAAGLDKLIELTLSVEDVGIYKPSRRVYRHALQRLQIPDAPSICFVSANGWDAQGAAQFGFQSVRLARSPAVDERLPGKPAAHIASLSELPGCSRSRNGGLLNYPTISLPLWGGIKGGGRSELSRCSQDDSARSPDPPPWPSPQGGG